MRTIILAIVCLISVSHLYAQNKNETYYLREFDAYSPIGKDHYYQIMRFSGSDVDLTVIKVQGKIGNPIKTDFFIDSCYKWIGKMNSLDSGYLSINDESKWIMKIKKRSDQKLIVDLNGVVVKYNRVSETVNFLVKLESYCFCRPIVPAASR
jgi:hypothetical protein